MSVIKFDVRVSTHSVGGLDPDDVWSRDSTEGSVEIVGARLEAKDGYDCLFTDKEVAPGATVWLVWAEYTTGDSFGSDGGNYELLEICHSAEDAESRKTHFAGVTDYSVPWNGYFENLDSLNVSELVLS